MTTPAASSTPVTDKHVHAIRGWRRLLLAPLGWVVRLWGATLRFEITPEDRCNLSKIDEPVAFVIWHNRLFLVSEIFRRYRQRRPIYALVSASKDGAWLEAFFSLVGIRCVRGSSSRLGREAVTALVNVVRAGNDIGITPDGPRGPRYDFKAGGVIVARRARTPVLLIGAQFQKGRQLRSWDGFWLPRPFSRVRLHCDLISPEALSDRDETTSRLRTRMLEMNPDDHLAS